MVKIDLDNDGKILSCYQRIDYKNNDSCFFRLVASYGSLGKINNNELKKTLNAYFTTSRQENNIYDVVKSLRTIFRGLGEIELEVRIFNKSEKMIESVLYKIGTLCEYERATKIEGTSAIETKVDNSGITTKWGNNQLDIKYLETVKDVALIFESLLKIEPNEINIDDRILCSIYEQFYGEMPDFRKDSDTTKMYLLSLCLMSFGLHFIGSNEKFNTFLKDYPILQSQQEQIEKLKLFGNLNEGKDEFLAPLDIDVINRINSVKNAFSTSSEINNTKISNLKALKNIAIIAYIYKYEFMCQEKNAIDYARVSGMPLEEADKALSFYKTAQLKK